MKRVPMVCMAVVSLVVIGCGSSKTLVMKPPEQHSRVSLVRFSENRSNVDVPEEIRKAFSEKLTLYFYQEGGYGKGEDLAIEYRFIGYNPGSRFTRYMVGPLGGEGSITIAAKFLDSNRQEIGEIQCEGTIKGGVFGGSIDYAADQAARELAEFTKKNFLIPREKTGS